MKMTKEEFIEIEKSHGTEIPPNVDVVPCTCEDVYCPGWRLEKEMKEKHRDWLSKKKD